MLRGHVILADRVSLEHRFLLRPDRQMRELFLYLLQFYADVHGIRIHAVVLMSTHYHLLFTDVRGIRGEFFRDFHAMLAKAVRVYHGTRVCTRWFAVDSVASACCAPAPDGATDGVSRADDVPRGGDRGGRCVRRRHRP